MKTVKSILPIVGIATLFLGYSYYNYSERAKALDFVETYMENNNSKRIWNIREVTFNVFDWMIKDKSQYYLIYVNTEHLEKDTNEDYWVQFSFWRYPQDLESLTNYTVKRKGDIFHISMWNMLWAPMGEDSLNFGEIDGTVFETVDEWIKKEEYESM